MLSKNNTAVIRRRLVGQREFHFGLRKLNIGVASVLLGTTIFFGVQTAHADSITPVDRTALSSVSQPSAPLSTDAAQTGGGGQGLTSQDRPQDAGQTPSSFYSFVLTRAAQPAVGVTDDNTVAQSQYPVQGSLSADQAATHVIPAQSINVNQGFKNDYFKTTNTDESLKYAGEISANFNDNAYQSDPVAATEQIDYRHLTQDQINRINQYQISLVNSLRGQMGLPDYVTNQPIINWQMGQAQSQADRHLWGHHLEYLHGAGEDVGSLLINNQIGTPVSQWKPSMFSFKRDPQVHTVVAFTPVGAIKTMDDLQAFVYYITTQYLFEDDGAEANGHGHNLLDWNLQPNTYVALGLGWYHEDKPAGEAASGDQLFARFIIPNADTMQVAHATNAPQLIVPNQSQAVSQQVIHLVDDTNPTAHVNDLVIKNPTGTILSMTPAVPNGYQLVPGQTWPTRFDFTHGNLPDLTVHVIHHVTTLWATDPRRNTIFSEVIHYQADGTQIAPDTRIEADFTRDYTIDDVTGQPTIGHWHYVNKSLRQSGTQIPNLGAPGDEYNRVAGMDSFNFWIPFSVKVNGYHVNYTGLNMAWSAPNGAGVAGGQPGEYTVNYTPDDQVTRQYQDRTITVHFVNDHNVSLRPDAVLLVRYYRDATKHLSGNLNGQTTTTDWQFVGNNYSDDGFTHGMKAQSGDWNIPASWNVISVNVPQIDGMDADLSGNSHNVNHVPANKFVYPTFDQNVFTDQETVYEAQPDHTIVYHMQPTLTVNVVDDDSGQVIGTTGRVLNPQNGGYATVSWQPGIDQAHFNYQLVNVTGIPNGFVLTGDHHHTLNQQSTFTDIQYPNFDWQGEFKSLYAGSVLTIHVKAKPDLSKIEPVQLVDSQTGKVLAAFKATGLTVDLSPSIPDGYVPYAGQRLTGSSADFVDGPTILLGHRMMHFVSGQGVSAGASIPNTKSMTYPQGLSDHDLHRTVTRTIRVHDIDGQLLSTSIQSVNFYREADFDVATGQITYSSWRNRGLSWLKYQPAYRMGETIAAAPEVAVSPDMPNQVSDLQYQAAPRVANVQYEMADGQILKRQLVSFSESQPLQLTAPAGYRLMTATAISSPKAGERYDVLVTPVMHYYDIQSTGVPQGMELQRAVVRSFVIQMPNGHTRTIKQTVHFMRTATVNARGVVKYSAWQATGRSVWHAVHFTDYRGYSLVADGLPVTQSVTADTASQVVHVKYIPDR